MFLYQTTNIDIYIKDNIQISVTFKDIIFGYIEKKQKHALLLI